MKKYKVPLIISLIACTMIAIGVPLLGTWKMGWFSPSVPEETTAIPDREIRLDKDMKENIFKQMSENVQESRGPFVTIDENGQKTYAWQAIEDLLHKKPVDMEIPDYVALLQVIEEMIIQNNGEMITDIEATKQLIQRGYQGAYLTSTMANLCTLYKEWLETCVLVAPRTYGAGALFGSRKTEEEKTLGERMKQQMFTAAILNGILMNENELVQSKSPSQPTPEISITYKQKERFLPIHYLIQIGDKAVRIHAYNRALYHPIRDEFWNIELLPWDETKKVNKKQEYAALSSITDAYDMGGTVSVTEDGTIQIVACINESELELRARAYDRYLYDQAKKNGEDPQYQGITGSDFKDMYSSHDPTQKNEYVVWWNSVGIETTGGYKSELTKIAYKDPELIGTRVESLTPAQIDQLDKQLKATSGGA